MRCAVASLLSAALVTILPAAQPAFGSPHDVALTASAVAQAGPADAVVKSPAPPISFVANLGQWDRRATFAARMGPLTAYLEDRGWTFTLVQPVSQGDPDTSGRAVRHQAPPALRGVAVRMRFSGGSERPTQEPEQRLPGCHSYFLGNDPARWRTGVPLYSSVRYHDLYPGIDLRLRESGATLEYDLLLDPRADLSRVQVVVEGVEGLRLCEDGALVLDTALGPITQPPPQTWQVDGAGRQHAVACRYVLLAEDRFGFVAPERDLDWSLVVDPKLVHSTYLGGNDFDYASDIAVDPSGRTLVVGRTLSLNYPTTTGAFSTTFNGGPWDGFVTLMNATGTGLVYSTFLGGDNAETVFAGKLDASGVAHVTGGTRSTNFPTTPGAFDTTHNGTRDAFHARLNPTGSALVYSTLLGAAGDDYAWAMHVDAAGQITTICGTAGAAFPTTPNAYAPTFVGGSSDAFVARIDPSQPTAQQLVYSTYLGGSLDDWAWAVTEDSAGVLTIAGDTTSPTFPTTAGAHQTQIGGGGDAFVSRLDPAQPPAQQLVWSTYLGGNLNDFFWSLGVGTQGWTVGGNTQGGTFPTTPGAYSPTFNGGADDGFVARLSLDGTRLVWSTFLGGSAGDELSDLWVDNLGQTTVVGWTQSPGLFPTTPGALKRARALNEGFVTQLDPAGSRLLYSTYLGGSVHDGAWFLVADQAGVATITGATTSPDFPTTPGAYNTVRNDPPGNAYDAFVTRLQTVPTGVRRYGDVSVDCAGRKPTIHALDDALAGSATFGLATSQGAPGATALLLISTRPTAGVPVLGVQIFVDLAAPMLMLPVSTDGAGEVQVPIPIPGQSRGTLYVQFVLFHPRLCAAPFSATDALELAW